MKVMRLAVVAGLAAALAAACVDDEGPFEEAGEDLDDALDLEDE